MRRFLLVVSICVFFTGLASAQTNYLPSIQAGLKGGADYSMFPAADGLHNKNEFGYIGGFWARFGGQGLFFQPELYYVSRNFTTSQVYQGFTYTDHSKFTSMDVPLLVGYKEGNIKMGFRFYTGPVPSFSISKFQSFLATSAATHVNYKDINYSWQFGGGVDIHDFSLDVRYELGLSKIPYGTVQTANTHFNLVNITLSYSIFSDYGGE